MAGAYLPAVSELWATRIPRLALSYEPLLNALFAFSAQHILVVGSSELSAELATFRAKCLDSALRKHRESLSTNQAWNSSPRSADMVCFTSVLLMHDALAGLSMRPLNPYEPPLQWFRMARGVFFLGSAAMSVAAEDPESHFMALVRSAEDLRDGYNPDAEEHKDQLTIFPELIRAKAKDGETWLETDEDRADDEAMDAYNHTVGQIAVMKKALDRGAGWQVLGRRLTMFAVVLRPRFIELLRDKRPKALVILGYYFAIAAFATEFWWVGDVPFREFDALESAVPDEWQHLLKWPREVVGGQRLRRKLVVL
jgi:hypothetical protein